MPHLVILKFSVMLFAIIVVFNARLAKIKLLWALNFKDYLNLHGRFQKKLAKRFIPAGARMRQTLFGVFRRRLTITSIRRFTKAEWHISVLDHMLDLALHGDNEENNEIQQEDGPEHWHVKYTKECHADGRQHRSCARVPELELRESSCERSG